MPYRILLLLQLSIHMSGGSEVQKLLQCQLQFLFLAISLYSHALNKFSAPTTLNAEMFRELRSTKFLMTTTETLSFNEARPMTKEFGEWSKRIRMVNEQKKAIISGQHCNTKKVKTLLMRAFHICSVRYVNNKLKVCVNYSLSEPSQITHT